LEPPRSPARAAQAESAAPTLRPIYVRAVSLTNDAAPLAVGRPITLRDLEEVARGRRRVELCKDARGRVDASRAAIEAIAAAGDAGPPVYGVNTGFGALAETRISERDVRALQLNL